MTTTRDFDRLARAWLDLMPDEAPDRLVANVRLAVDVTPQQRRPGWLVVRRPLGGRRLALYAAVALIALAVVGASLVATIGRPAPEPSKAPANGPIVGYGMGNLFVAEPGATPAFLPLEQAGLVHGQSCPAFSSDGRWLAMLTGTLGATDEHLSISRPDGTGLQQLWRGTFNDQAIAHHVVWASDGRTVAATGALIDGRSYTVVGHVDRSPADLVASRGWEEYPGSIALSPDGSQLATIGSNGDGAGGLDVVDVATGDSRRIVDANVTGLAWSPDGQTIAYTVAVSHSLQFVHPDGSTAAATVQRSDEGFGYMAWSGSLLGVLTATGPESARVEVFDATGSTIEQFGPFTLTPDPEPAATAWVLFTWAPDGRSILVNDPYAPPFVVGLDGTTQVLAVPGFSNGGGYCPLAWGRLRPVR